MLRGHVFKFQTFSNDVFSHFINTFLQGNMGITKGCELSNTSNSVSIGAGYFCVMGRFLEILGSETIEDITSAGYYSLVCEIDLNKINTKTELNQAVIKVISNTGNYATLQKDDLFSDGKIYQYEFARFRVSEAGIVDFEDRRTFLNVISLYNQILANFDSVLNEKSESADELLNQIQEELNSIIDGSAFILKSTIQVVSELPTQVVDGTIYIQTFD